jgi:hypothetical protein
MAEVPARRGGQMSDPAEDETAVCRHEGCDKRFTLANYGNRTNTSERRRKGRHLFCSSRCRKAHSRRLAALGGGVTAPNGTIPKGGVTAHKTPPFSSGKTASLEAIRPETKTGKSPQLEWQEVNAVTWRLIDPNAPQLRIEASHGQWGGYHHPKALAYVSDVGVNDRDWRRLCAPARQSMAGMGKCWRPGDRQAHGAGRCREPSKTEADEVRRPAKPARASAP